MRHSGIEEQVSHDYHYIRTSAVRRVCEWMKSFVSVRSRLV